MINFTKVSLFFWFFVRTWGEPGNEATPWVYRVCVLNHVPTTWILVVMSLSGHNDINDVTSLPASWLGDHPDQKLDHNLEWPLSESTCKLAMRAANVFNLNSLCSHSLSHWHSTLTLQPGSSPAVRLAIHACSHTLAEVHVSVDIQSSTYNSAVPTAYQKSLIRN